MDRLLHPEQADAAPIISSAPARTIDTTTAHDDIQELLLTLRHDARIGEGMQS